MEGEADLGQVILNLLTINSQRELCQQFDVTPEEIASIPKLFSVGSAMLDLHYDTLPELHTKSLLLLTDSKGSGVKRVAGVR